MLKFARDAREQHFIIHILLTALLLHVAKSQYNSLGIAYNFYHVQVTSFQDLIQNSRKMLHFLQKL